MIAPTEDARCQEVDDPLDRGVGAVIGDFEPAVRPMLRGWPVVEAAVGERSAEALVQQRHLDAFGVRR
jgi:hypothetical protein